MKDKLVHLLTAILMELAFVVLLGGMGAAAAYVAGATLHDGLRARKWAGVEANVESAGAGHVLYSYTFKERRYTGARLGASVFPGTDNVGTWQENIESRLRMARSQGRPITIWVNPGNPSESMVDREIRWSLLAFFLAFALGFGGMGLGGLVALVYTILKRLKGRRASEAARKLGALWVRWGIDVEVPPGARASAAVPTASFNNERPPVGFGPGFEPLERILNRGVPLTDQQRRAVTPLSPEERAAAAQFMKWAPAFNKAWWTGIVLWLVAVGIFVVAWVGMSL